MKRALLASATIIAGVLYLSAPVKAANIDFGLNALGNTKEGVTHTFTNNGVSIIAKDENILGGQLFGKFGGTGTDENGLGYTQGI